MLVLWEGDCLLPLACYLRARHRHGAVVGPLHQRELSPFASSDEASANVAQLRDDRNKET